MVAAAVFLNRGVTLGAFFGVCRDPICGLRVVCTFLEPLLDELTGSRLMVCQDAAKAETMLAITDNRWYDLVKILLLDPTFNGVNTIRSRAPLQLILIFDIGSCE
jgi:hypothetical protein